MLRSTLPPRDQQEQTEYLYRGCYIVFNYSPESK
jgi:hypothetical protein